jgi:hypothetical protein
MVDDTIESLASAIVIEERVCACGTAFRALRGAPETMTCDACIDRALRECAKLKAITAFERTVPAAYEWATLGAPELAQRVSPADRIGYGRVALLREPWVVFVGPSGTGKTSLAVALVRERVRVTGEPWVMCLAHRLGAARIQHRAGDGEPRIIEEAMRAKFLLLDDIGQETMTATNPIADIVNERDAERLPTWVTTGLTARAIGERYNGGVARRLFERSKRLTLEAPDPLRTQRFDARARAAGDDS